MNKLYTFCLAFVHGVYKVLGVRNEQTNGVERGGEAAASPRHVHQARKDEAAASAALRTRVERALEAAVDRATAAATTPPRLRDAIRHAVFPGGARLRPQLCLVAAIANGDSDPGAADAAAASVELIHCASLVHDDMPCFDDADVRRGRPSVHKQFGQPIALLVGDALIVHAFAEVGRAGHRAGELLSVLAEAAGAARGIIAGQAWETEPASSLVSLDEYHRAKTASLFSAAAMMGAIVGRRAGGDGAAAAWGRFGEAIGRVYQAADDLADVTGRASVLGKPVGRDAILGRPNLVRVEGGVEAARQRMADLVAEAREVIPSTGDGSPLLNEWMFTLLARFGLPSSTSPSPSPMTSHHPVRS